MQTIFRNEKKMLLSENEQNVFKKMYKHKTDFLKFLHSEVKKNRPSIWIAQVSNVHFVK